MRQRPAASVESGGKNSGVIRIANQSNGPSGPPLGQPRRQAQDPVAQDEDKSSNTLNNSGELRVISSASHRCWSIRFSQRLKARCSLRATTAFGDQRASSRGVRAGKVFIKQSYCRLLVIQNMRFCSTICRNLGENLLSKQNLNRVQSRFLPVSSLSLNAGTREPFPHARARIRSGLFSTLRRFWPQNCATQRNAARIRLLRIRL